MSALAELDATPNTIEATVNYVENNGEQAVHLHRRAGLAPTGARGGTLDPQQVTMHNGRPHVDSFKLERDGFRFVRHPTRRCRISSTRTKSRASTTRRWIELIKAESGAKRVVVFDHTLRTADDEMREARKIREVVRRVHNDYTEWSGPQRVRDLLPDEADESARSGASPSSRCGGRSAIRSRPFRSRSADARSVASTISSSPSGAIPTASARPTPSPTIPKHQWYLVPAHAARRGAGVQGLRFAEGRPRALDRAHRLRRSDHAAQRAAAREHRNPDAGVFLAAHRRSLRSSPL